MLREFKALSMPLRNPLFTAAEWIDSSHKKLARVAQASLRMSNPLFFSYAFFRLLRSNPPKTLLERGPCASRNHATAGKELGSHGKAPPRGRLG